MKQLNVDSIFKRMIISVNTFDLAALRAAHAARKIPDLSLYSDIEVERDLESLIGYFVIMRNAFVKSKREADNAIFCMNNYIKESRAKYGK